MDQVLEALRDTTKDTPYEGRLYLVGGIVRDKVLGIKPEEDIDIVLEGDAGELAEFLYKAGVAEHAPVTYPRFGTAMISVLGTSVELVGARKESYRPHSRKPSTRPGTLKDDVYRRDFTINTLLENLYTGEILDLTGLAFEDIRNQIIRTPLDPHITFDDDPLRMLRAIRFAARFNFVVDSLTYAAICDRARRLRIISAERIREEFSKTLMSDGAVMGLNTLRETKLLDQFAPELSSMHGVTQNIYHIYDVWTHSMKTLELIPAQKGITLRLAALLHDVGKVETRTVAEDGAVHFYRHEAASAEIAHSILNRLKFPRSVIADVVFLISMHLRVGEYDNEWSDAAVRRLIRDAGGHLEDLVVLTRADKGAANPAMPSVDLEAFCARVDRIKAELSGMKMVSPLSGREIMDLLEIESGPRIGAVKAFLENQVVEGNLLPGDKTAAAELVLRNYGCKAQ